LTKSRANVDDHVFLAADHAPASKLNQDVAGVHAVVLRGSLRVPEKAGVDAA
jgi:hypothetical protein